ncbi:MFS transporter [Brevibacterium casei]|uniref:MFS transporter n=3 Tax=Bacteria TaxID=2 RepID=UPI0011A109A0|nr:MFS transporter [Brevibacterium casei]MCT1447599.1 MFS transporter [Brevibacterium casei]MCT1551398.1 MFS transporter [Brevibacterium casei]MCT1560960.1 MFS transporter [Brevibacterium casei]MCT1765404.1 MFS transporter [Brevibacterium casei]MCT2184295.1 MFS transporter [Brevibacterium casei]
MVLQPTPPATTTHPGSESRRKAWSLTALLVVLYVVNYGDKAAFGIIAQALKDELGISAAQIGLVGSLFFFAFTIGGFFAGALNRWMSLRTVLLVLALVWAAAMLPLVVSATFAVLVVSRMLLGIAEGPSSALIHTAAYSWHPTERRGFPGALLASAASVAKIVLAPLLAYLSVTYGWRSALITMAVIGIVWCVFWLRLWEVGPYIPAKATGPAKASGPTNTSSDTGTDEPRVPWARILLTRTFLTGVPLVASIYALVTVVLTWLPSYFEVGLGFSRLEAGSMLAIPSVVGLISLIGGTLLSDFLLARGWSSRFVRIVGPSLLVIVGGGILFLLPSIENPAAAVAIVSIGYGVGVVVLPLSNAAVSEICPPEQTAGTLGIFLALMAIGGLIGPYVTGLIVDAAASPGDGYATAFQVLGVAAALSALLTLIFADPERDKVLVRGDNARSS